MSEVCLGIPVRDAFNYLSNLLHSVGRYTNREIVSEIIVIDDGSIKRVAKYFRNVRIIRNSLAIGFPAACNQIIKNSTSEFICILNSDTFVSPCWLDLLLEVMDDKDVGIAGPSTSYANNPQCRQDICRRRHSMSEREIVEYSRRLRNTDDEPKDIGRSLTGFCMMIRRSAVLDVGFFDEQFGLGSFEEADMCMRMMNKGYKCMWVPRAYVHHYGKGTFKKMNWVSQWKENQKKFEKKWNL